MTMLDRLPGMDLKTLATLRTNAARLSQSSGPKQADATTLLAAIDAELGARQQVKDDAAARKKLRAASPKPPLEPKAERSPQVVKLKKSETASEKADAIIADIAEAIARK